MSDESEAQLIGRAWGIQGPDRVLLGDRRRRPDGSVVMSWHVPPEEHRGVIWLENLEVDRDQGSAT